MSTPIFEYVCIEEEVCELAVMICFGYGYMMLLLEGLLCRGVCLLSFEDFLASDGFWF